MAARRGKNQATRNSGHATPPWVWLVLGLLIGLAVYFIVPGLGKKDGDGFFRPQPNPDAQPAPIDSADVESVVPDAPAGDTPPTAATDASGTKETQYDFYTLLPGKEVQMSDAELAASAREEDARKARAALNGQATTPVATTPADVAPAQPAPIDETSPPRANDAPRVADAAATPRPAPPSPAPTPARATSCRPARSVRPAMPRPPRPRSPCSASAPVSNRRRSTERPSIACAWGRTARPANWPRRSRSSPAAACRRWRSRRSEPRTADAAAPAAGDGGRDGGAARRVVAGGTRAAGDLAGRGADAPGIPHAGQLHRDGPLHGRGAHWRVTAS